MATNNINNQYSEIHSTRNKYIFLLVLFLFMIITLAVLNPFHIFSDYLYVTLPMILFFLSFVISMLFLYNRNPTSLTQSTALSKNWVLRSFINFIQFGFLLAFTYWISTSFTSKTFEDFEKNTYGDKYAIIFNVAMLGMVFIFSLIYGRFSMLALGSMFILFLGLYIFFQTILPIGNKYINAPVLCFYSIIGIGFSLLLNNSKLFEIVTKNETIMNSYFLRALMFLFGFGVSASFIYWIAYTIGSLSGKSTAVSVLLNILIISTILGLLYKAITAGGIFTSVPIVRLFINIILYIPCIFVYIFEFIAYPLRNFSFTQEYQNTTRGSVYMLLFAILLLLIYFNISRVKNMNVLQGGNQLLNDPIHINNEKNLASYASLNGSNSFNYQYGISFWFYIDSNSLSSNSAYLKYTNLLTYGNKPGVKYNPSTNSLMIVVDETGGPSQKSQDFIVDEYDVDENGMRIIYTQNKILLQKWNNVIINYTGGTLDVFYNGVLVNSSEHVIPYMKFDSLSVGQNNGLYGGICNVIYFNKPLTGTQIYYIYNSVKNKTPPTLYDSNFDILQNEFNLAGETSDVINSDIQSTLKTSVENYLPSGSFINMPSASVSLSSIFSSLIPSTSIPAFSIPKPTLNVPSIQISNSSDGKYKIPSEYESKIPSEYKSQIPSEYQSQTPSEYQSQAPADGKIPSEYQSQIPTEYQSQIPSQYLSSTR